MAAYELLVSPGQATQPDACPFLWGPGQHGMLGTFQTTLGPRLGRLGNIPEPNVDFVRLAVTVLAADRSTPRQAAGSNWSQRHIEITVPVFDPSRWGQMDAQLADLLGFMTGDEWRLSFTMSPPSKERIALRLFPAEQVMLFSGGADSTAAAVDLISSSARPLTLVSHFGAATIAKTQRCLYRQLVALSSGKDITHSRIQMNRKAKRVNSTPFGNEYQMRSRSLLFIALGLAVASASKAELIVPENGFVSLVAVPPASVRLAVEAQAPLVGRCVESAHVDDESVVRMVCCLGV